MGLKNLPAMQETQETWIWSLGQEDLLEKVMATHSSFLAWKIPWTEESGGLQSIGLQKVGHDWSNLAAPWLGNSQLHMLGFSGDTDLEHFSSKLERYMWFLLLFVCSQVLWFTVSRQGRIQLPHSVCLLHEESCATPANLPRWMPYFRWRGNYMFS